MKKLTLSLLGLFSMISTNSFADNMKLYYHQSILHDLEINLAQYNYDNAKSERSIYSIKFFGTTDSGRTCSFTYNIHNGLTNKVIPSNPDIKIIPPSTSSADRLNLEVTLSDRNQVTAVLKTQFIFGYLGHIIGAIQFPSSNYSIRYSDCSFSTKAQYVRFVQMPNIENNDIIPNTWLSI